MKKFYFPIFIIIAVLAASGIYYIVEKWTPLDQNPQGESFIKKEITREEIMIDVSKKINEISPTNSVIGGTWYILRFWFIQESNTVFYTEYEDGHIMSKILIEIENSNYNIVAIFEPGEVDWKLIEGEDKFFGESLDLYEHSEELNGWINKN